MNKEFDYVAFAKNFEATNGRPPTADELDNAKWEHFGIRWHTPEESQAELERINASYKPTWSEHLKDALSFLGRGFFKALFFVLVSPIYLTMLFFNLIKSAIGVFMVWFVSKFVLGMIIGVIASIKYGTDLSTNPFPAPFRGIVDFILGRDFFQNAVPNFFPHPMLDTWIIGIAIILLALVATFAKVEENK
ncbi:hypothetical protein HMPREF9171_1886 [Streptococcus agalactiae ATCC 13813]|uniref:Uncharacterized protein n=1 Tax=Streptococcus agalactiae TaxID=1311 RepID=A0A7Z7K7C3_STRAG|nr:hypothetical protein [Streptococcus agalactiae]EFV96583.1 hypothetical protein HMPREF9171_1886 [Streptococcus agalactiae ATCC 13813]KLL30514.1 hypothetical protein WA00_04935 [Streptococcus agalactiae]KLL93497.1 hypothetical protein VZ99_07615 [Streptococcus agalactiae]PHU32207.1 hypothetical protein CSW65_10970 [Streptococcus agalactiae]SQA17805.1 Uncharacterised protein [Streptococcus agalactiae]